MLPLGRGSALRLNPRFYSSLDDDVQRIACGARRAPTSGLGLNLYIGPSGMCYPCHALMGKRRDVGNALVGGLPPVLVRNGAYRCFTRVPT